MLRQLFEARTYLGAPNADAARRGMKKVHARAFFIYTQKIIPLILFKYLPNPKFPLQRSEARLIFEAANVVHSAEQSFGIINLVTMPPLFLNQLPDFFMSRSLLFYFSLSTLILGVGGSLYLLLEWWRHLKKHKFFIFWSVGLLLLYWFQLPFILANAGVGFILTGFNLFYSITFPLTFLGLVLIYFGIISISPFTHQKIINRFLFLWFIFSIVIYAIYFLIGGGVLESYTSTFITLFFFFVPIHLFILFALWRWYRRQDWSKTKVTSLGIILMMLSMFSALAQDFLALKRTLAYPPQFWFLAIADSKSLYFLETSGVFLLLLGFFFVHRNYSKLNQR